MAAVVAPLADVPDPSARQSKQARSWDERACYGVEDWAIYSTR